MKAATAVIAEDEPLLRAEIRDVLRSLWPDLAIVAEVGDGLEAIRAIDRSSPAIVFLDVQMPGASGLEVAQHASGRAHVVFITAYDHHAVAAFEKGALDFILKPMSIPRMELTVTRLKERLREPPADLSGLERILRQATGAEPRYIKWMTVPHGAELRVITTAEIQYLRADQKYTTIVTRGGTFLLSSSLRQLKDSLDPGMFWQIHRSIIVNVGAIEAIYRSFRGSLDVKLRDRSELLPVSASHAHLFKQPGARPRPPDA